MKLQLNVKQWNELRMNTERSIRDLKHTIRTPRHMPSGSEYHELRNLQTLATHLYTIRAEIRGHLHCKVREVYHYGPDSTMRELVPVTREDQMKILQAYLPTALAKPETGLFWQVIPQEV